MADKKISDLDPTDALDGSELLLASQDGNSRKTTVEDIANSEPMNTRFAGIPDPVAMAIIFGGD